MTSELVSRRTSRVVMGVAPTLPRCRLRGNWRTGLLTSLCRHPSSVSCSTPSDTGGGCNDPTSGGTHHQLATWVASRDPGGCSVAWFTSNFLWAGRAVGGDGRRLLRGADSHSV